MRKKVHFLQEQLDNCYSFETYKTFVSDLVSQGKTSGPEQREDLIHYTELNAKRMKRVEKTTVLTEAVKENLFQGRSGFCAKDFFARNVNRHDMISLDENMFEINTCRAVQL